jgi:hypothetical protein
MAWDFPAAPTNGQVFTTPTGVEYIWNGTVWKANGPVQVSGVYVSDTPPAAPIPDNMLWYESDTGIMWIRYRDADSVQWVQANPGGLPDAPNDNRAYGRRNATWVPTPVLSVARMASTTYGGTASTTTTVVGPLSYTVKAAGSRIALRGRLQLWAVAAAQANAEILENAPVVQLALGSVTHPISTYFIVNASTDYAHGRAAGAVIQYALNCSSTGAVNWNGGAAAQPGFSCELTLMEYMP